MSVKDFRRVLVTGGTGFVGGHLCPRLAAAWPQAQRLLLTRPGEEQSRADFERHAVDLCDPAAVEAVVARFAPDLVVHLAAQSSVPAARGAAEDTWRINFGATFGLAQACARHSPAVAFFFASTAEVYGASLNDGPATEDTPARPGNPYARAKLAAEMALGDVLPSESTLVIARAFNHAGPGQDTRFALPSFSAQIAEIEAGLRGPKLMVGNLSAQRDFLDVRDVCDAYVLLMRMAPPRSRDIYNVASGSPRRIADLLEQLRRVSGQKIEIAVDPARDRPSEVPVVAGRADKLRALTGWTPRVDLAATLRDVLEEQRKGVKASRAS